MKSLTSSILILALFTSQGVFAKRDDNPFRETAFTRASRVLTHCERFLKALDEPNDSARVGVILTALVGTLVIGTFVVVQVHADKKKERDEKKRKQKNRWRGPR